MALALEKVRKKFEEELIAAVLGETEKADEKDKVHSLPIQRYLEAKAILEGMEAAAYAEIVYSDMAALVEVTWEGAKTMLHLTEGFDTPPVWAYDFVQEAANYVGSLVVERDQAALTDVLEAAFLNGSSAADTADALRDAFSAGITRVAEDGTKTVTPADSWFSTVARTELQRAAVQGQVALYQAAGVQTVRWDVAVPCDACAEADGVILPLGEDFPGVDVSQPPAHPNCRCILVPADADLGG